MIFVFIEIQFELSNHITHYFFKKYILFIHIKSSKLFSSNFGNSNLFYPFLLFILNLFILTHISIKKKKKKSKKSKNKN